MTDVDQGILVRNSSPCVYPVAIENFTLEAATLFPAVIVTSYILRCRVRFFVRSPKGAFKSNIFPYSNLNVSTILLSVLGLSSIFSNHAGHVRLATIHILSLIIFHVKS
jgi:hypothetical protein